MVTPLLTTCCTHGGDVLAAGWITPDGSPSGIDDCNCNSPSRIHRPPNPTRTTRRASGSAVVGRADGKAV